MQKAAGKIGLALGTSQPADEVVSISVRDTVTDEESTPPAWAAATPSTPKRSSRSS